MLFRSLSSGVYTFLPLGWRVLRRIEQVVREELDAARAQEMLMPILQPEEIWAETGRLHTMEDVLFRLEAKGGKFVLGPTHEEVVTATVAAEVDSYRDLPLIVYQIQLTRDAVSTAPGLRYGFFAVLAETGYTGAMNIENEDEFYYPAYVQGNFTEQYKRGFRVAHEFLKTLVPPSSSTISWVNFLRRMQRWAARLSAKRLKRRARAKRRVKRAI